MTTDVAETCTLPVGFKDEIRAFHLVSNQPAVLTMRHFMNSKSSANMNTNSSTGSYYEKQPICHNEKSKTNGFQLPKWCGPHTMFNQHDQPFLRIWLSESEFQDYLVETHDDGGISIRRVEIQGNFVAFKGLKIRHPRSLTHPTLSVFMTSASLDETRVVRVSRLSKNRACLNFDDVEEEFCRDLIVPLSSTSITKTTTGNSPKRQRLEKDPSRDFCLYSIAQFRGVVENIDNHVGHKISSAMAQRFKEHLQRQVCEWERVNKLIGVPLKGPKD